ncbi:MAG: cell division FtsZ family protein [Candidatus Aureabacteria bacterium]|nr:cell division FtsZ family protein [Candidatus Auribacterota bacterium]
MLRFDFQQNEKKLVFKLFGLGDGGINTLDTFINKGIGGMELIAVNTEPASLEKSAAHRKIEIGGSAVKGQGTGGDISVGKKAAENAYKEFFEASHNADVVFVTAGLGGGTGSGAINVVVRAAKEAGSLVVCLVTKPFNFEGRMRLNQATESVKELKDIADSLIIIPNDRLLDIMTEDTSFVDAFKATNEVICEVVNALYAMVTKPSLIKIDFADVKSVLEDGGECMLGFGDATGKDKALRAVEMALVSPLMDKNRLMNSKNILISMIGGRDIGLFEVSDSLKSIQQITSMESNAVLGVTVDEDFNDRVHVTVLASGSVSEEKRDPAFELLPDMEDTREEQPALIHVAPRGKFDKTEPSIIDGIDLDVPTFLRKSKRDWYTKIMGKKN